MPAMRTGSEFNRARVYTRIYIGKQTKLTHMTHSISVVDDSDGIRRSFRMLLEHAGYCVTEFSSGKEFLNSGLEEPADCILLDLEMPGPNGIEVLRALRDLACNTPVIVVSGTHNATMLADADCDNVAAILKKPIGSNALLAAVDGALSQSSHNG